MPPGLRAGFSELDVTFPLRMREYWYASAAMSAMNFWVARARSRERWRGVWGAADPAPTPAVPEPATFMPFVTPFVGGLPFVEPYRRGFEGA